LGSKGDIALVIEIIGAGEGIRTLDPNLGKIRLYEISNMNQVLIKFLKNPNTIRTFSAAFSQKALCSGFQKLAEGSFASSCDVLSRSGSNQ